MKITKLLLIIFGICLIFVMSESVYAFRNPYVLSDYSFTVSKLLSSSGDIDGAFLVLTKTARIISKQNSVTQLSLPKDSQFKHKIANYLNTLPYNSLSTKGNYDLARVFYDFAILAYDNGQAEYTPKLLNISLVLNPNLSFWSVALANYYLFENNPDMAKIILDKCISLNAPKKHCQDYLNNNFATDRPMGVGFLQDTVSSYYASGGR